MSEIKNDSTEIAYPEKVYKYRDWSDKWHKRILTHNEVFMSSPKDFNDPFDCRITTNFLHTLNSDNKKKEYLNYLFKQYESKTLHSSEVKQRKYRERLDELINDMEGFQKRADIIAISMQDDVFGILSLSCIWDNLLMWSHYGNNHKGFCVGYHEEKLRNSELFGSGGKVIYDSSYPLIHPNQVIDEDDMAKARRYYTMTHVKASDWSYEEEYRLMKTYPKRNVSDGERKITVSDEYFAELVLGCKFPIEEIDQMKRIAQEKQIPLYQAKKIPFKFQLERELLFIP